MSGQAATKSKIASINRNSICRSIDAGAVEHQLERLSPIGKVTRQRKLLSLIGKVINGTRGRMTQDWPLKGTPTKGNGAGRHENIARSTARLVTKEVSTQAS